MQSPEASLHNSHDPSTETAKNDPHFIVPISARKAALNEDNVLIASGMAVTVHAEARGDIDHRAIESSRKGNDEMIAREGKGGCKGANH